MTAINMPLMFEAKAPKAQVAAGEKCSPNNSFYSKLEQISCKQEDQAEVIKQDQVGPTADCNFAEDVIRDNNCTELTENELKDTEVSNDVIVSSTNLFYLTKQEENKPAVSSNDAASELLSSENMESVLLSVNKNSQAITLQQVIEQTGESGTITAKNGEQPVSPEPKAVSSEQLMPTYNSQSESKVTPSKAAYKGEKAIKEAPALQQWGKKLIEKTNVVLEPGTTEKNKVGEANALDSKKTALNTDVQKLIAMENQRINGSRFNTEPNTADGKVQFQIGSDDSRISLSPPSPSELELVKDLPYFKNPEGSKNLPAPREIINQIVQKADLLLNHKVSELKMDLKPDFLGKLSIEIMVKEDLITARFIADNQQVKQVLETNLNTLKQNLESQGFKVDRAEVSVALNNGGMFDGSENGRQNLWQQEQYRARQLSQEYPEESYEGIYPEEINYISPVMEQGINENGNMNFLV